MTNVTTALQPVAAPPTNVGPTILGTELRRKTTAVVNGLSHGVYIEVKFLGTRAYTNGRKIVLPKIKDLAEIKYATARALMGYAIHEVAHVRYTDFKAIERIFDDPSVVAAFGTDDKKEIVQRQKLIKKFENCIEDYRIEREMTREYPGTKSDLEALRIAIHPRLKTLSVGWFADPRSCGPLALTWLGARINGFQNQHLQQTLDHVPAPVMSIIDDWTERMTDVQSTAEAVDLAIAFELEAQAYAKATRDAAEAASKDAEECEPKTESDPPQEQIPQEGIDAPVQENPDKGPQDDRADDDEDSDQDDAARERDLDDASDDDQGGDPGDTADPSDGGDSGNGARDGAEADASDEDGKGSPQEGDEGDMEIAPGGDDGDDDVREEGDGDGDEGRNAPKDADTPQPSSGPDDGDARQEDADGPSPSEQTGGADVPDDGRRSADARSDGEDGQPEEDGIKFGSDRREKQASENDPRKTGPKEESAGKRRAEEGEEGEVDLNGELLDDYPDSKPEAPEAEAGEQDPVDRIDTADEDRGNDAPKEGDADADDDAAETGGADDGIGGGNDGGAFDDVLEDDARRDDAISDLMDEIHDRIAAGEPLPDLTPDGSDGEVDPSSLLDEISESNEEAPDYDSSDSDPHPNDQPEEVSRATRSMQHYGDARFRLAPNWSEEGCRHSEMQQKAAGAVSTTARTIKRLLMAEEKSGFLANRRSGDFDIRNVSAIARNTGTCYRRTWTKPAPKTLLVTLVDFSGSMEGTHEENQELESPIAIAMTGALAIEQAVKGTSVNSAMYGYTGSSPTVNMTVFKEGRQSEVVTKRRIGAFEKIEKRYTPTGEAMAAVAMRMDGADEERRILLVLTDGMADDMQLCADVTAVLIRRGIEVVVIGVQDDSAESWAPVHRTIMNLSELPAALLATIDPRAQKKRKRKMAA